jgi:hypothetical protein
MLNKLVHCEYHSVDVAFVGDTEITETSTFQPKSKPQTGAITPIISANESKDRQAVPGYRTECTYCGDLTSERKAQIWLPGLNSSATNAAKSSFDIGMLLFESERDFTTCCNFYGICYYKQLCKETGVN